MEIKSKVTITPAPGFVVKVGETDLGYFRQTAELEGVKRLVNDKGLVLVVVVDSGFAAVFADVNGSPREAAVIKATPELLMRISEADAK